MISGMKAPTHQIRLHCCQEALLPCQQVPAAECGVDELALPAKIALALVGVLPALAFCQG